MPRLNSHDAAAFASCWGWGQIRWGTAHLCKRGLGAHADDQQGHIRWEAGAAGGAHHQAAGARTLQISIACRRLLLVVWLARNPDGANLLLPFVCVCGGGAAFSSGHCPDPPPCKRGQARPACLLKPRHAVVEHQLHALRLEHFMDGLDHLGVQGGHDLQQVAGADPSGPAVPVMHASCMLREASPVAPQQWEASPVAPQQRETSPVAPSPPASLARPGGAGSRPSPGLQEARGQPSPELVAARMSPAGCCNHWVAPLAGACLPHTATAAGSSPLQPARRPSHNSTRQLTYEARADHDSPLRFVLLDPPFHGDAACGSWGSISGSACLAQPLPGIRVPGHQCSNLMPDTDALAL